MEPKAGGGSEGCRHVSAWQGARGSAQGEGPAPNPSPSPCLEGVTGLGLAGLLLPQTLGPPGAVGVLGPVLTAPFPTRLCLALLLLLLLLPLLLPLLQESVGRALSVQALRLWHCRVWVVGGAVLQHGPGGGGGGLLVE